MKQRSENISVEYLRSAIHYDALEGIFIWKHRSNKSKALNARMAGKFAGCDNGNGYIFIIIDRKAYLAHRIAWAIVTGKWPDKDIDHKDGNRANNRWTNLRLASRSQNCMNRKIPINNSSGFKGVCWDKNNKKWTAYIMANGKNHYLGLFNTPQQAHAERIKKADLLHKEFARVS